MRSDPALTPDNRTTYSHLQIGERAKIGRNQAKDVRLPA